jgi:hypothetical protein
MAYLTEEMAKMTKIVKKLKKSKKHGKKRARDSSKNIRIKLQQTILN